MFLSTDWMELACYVAVLATRQDCPMLRARECFLTGCVTRRFPLHACMRQKMQRCCLNQEERRLVNCEGANHHMRGAKPARLNK